jgi:PUA-like domain
MTEIEAHERGRPVVRLKPKAEARAIRHGFPWVYADELVTDRRTQSLAPGALAILEDGERRPLGLVTRPGLRRGWTGRWRIGRGFTRNPTTGWSMPKPTGSPGS